MIKLIASLLLTSGLALGVPSLAQASESRGDWFDKPGPNAKCVTGAETKALEGLSRAEAEAVLDGPGYRAPLWSGARDYRLCGFAWEHSRVTVHFGPANRVSYASVVIFRGGQLELPIGHPRA